MSMKKRPNKQKATPKVAKAKKMLTLKQGRFAAALMKTRTRREAAIIAGYSQKNIDQSANQAYNAILIKAPEAMGRAGLPLQAIIAITSTVFVCDMPERETFSPTAPMPRRVKLAQHKGQFTDFVELDGSSARREDDVKPTVRPPRKELNEPAPAKPAEPSSNAAPKKDPRPDR